MKTIAELLDLTGKAAVVTGGAKGIGAGIAYRLAEAGAAVVVADVDYTTAEETAESLRQHGFVAVAQKVDVSSEADIEAMLDSCVDQFGSVDILVNNAGIYPTVPVAELSEEL